MTATAQQKYREAHRDEINARQLAAYRAKPKGVTGTMGATESPDVVDFSAPNLRERYLLALLKRDAKIWRAWYRRTIEVHTNEPGIPVDAKPRPRGDAKPRQGRPPGSRQGETEKANRRATWAKKLAANKAKREKAERATLAARQAKFVRERHPFVIVRGSLFLLQQPVKPLQLMPPKRPKRTGKPKFMAVPNPPREAALAADKPSYIRATACKTCGGFKYRTIKNDCIGCKRIADKKRRDANNVKRTKKLAPLTRQA